MKDVYPILVATFACLGTFLYGVDTGIATTTIAHPSWVAYMKHPSNGVTGSVAAIYVAGEAVGAISQILFADRLGRLRFMQVQCVLVTIGCAIQTGSVNIGMFLAGRVLAGIAVGALSSTVPVYLSEISPPAIRGMIGGLNGAGLTFGTMVSNWIGFAGGYAPFGQIQWRVPLALQIPWGIVLFLGLVTFMPHSPRQLIQRGKVDEARAVFARIRSDLVSEEVHSEFMLMKAQIEYEQQREIPSWKEMWKLYRHRILVSVSVQILTSVTGINVVQYYQTILYKSLGIQSNTVLALAAVWGTCAFIATSISIVFLPDRWGRRNMLMAGMGWVVWSGIYSAVLQWKYQDTDNRVGKGFALLGIYLYGVGYYTLVNPVTWIYGAEVLPIAIRSRVMGLAATCHYVVNVAITEAGPSAFAKIHQNYYYVFVGCCAVYAVIIYFFYPETKQKTLEGIAAAFGDHVVTVKEEGEDTGMAKVNTNRSEHIE